MKFIPTMIFLLPLLILYSFVSNNISWSTSNGPEGATINYITSDENGRIYIATGGSGIYLSDNEGEDWIKTNLDLEDRFITSITVDPQNQIWAGSTMGKLYKSSDRGNNWELIYEHRFANDVNKILFDRSGNIFLGFGLDGIFTSIDSGYTFYKSDSGLTNHTVFDIIYCSDSTMLSSTASGIYKSYDRGNHWFEKQSYSWIESFAIDNSDYIYACSYGNILLTKDFGETWENVDKNLPVDNISTITINKKNELFIGLPDYGVYSSKDEGKTWKTKNLGLPTKSINYIHIDGNDNIHLGTDYHGFFSFNYDDSTWYRRNVNLSNSFINVAMNIDGQIYVGTQAIGLWTFNDNTETWCESNNGITNGNIKTITSYDNAIYVGTENGIFRSIDNGITWIEKSNGLPSKSIISMNAAQDGNIYAGISQNGIYQFADNEETWENITNDLPSKWVYGIVFDNQSNIYVGTFGDGVFKSENHGLNWISMNAGSHPHNVVNLYINKNEDIYAATLSEGLFRLKKGSSNWANCSGEYVKGMLFHPNGDIFLGTDRNGVFYSQDNSETWFRSNEGLVNTWIESISLTDDGYILAGTRGSGVYITTNTTNVENSAVTYPSGCVLKQNYPNPFNGRTKISFSLNETAQISLEIYNIYGSKITTLITGVLPQGNYENFWESNKNASGVYFYNLKIGKQSITKKMLLLQ